MSERDTLIGEKKALEWVLSEIQYRIALIDSKLVDCTVDKIKHTDAHDILSSVALATGHTMAEIISPNRSKSIVAARNIVIQRLRSETKMSTPEIGELIGGRSHSTILHSLKSINSGGAQ